MHKNIIAKSEGTTGHGTVGEEDEEGKGGVRVQVRDVGGGRHGADVLVCSLHENGNHQSLIGHRQSVPIALLSPGHHGWLRDGPRGYEEPLMMLGFVPSARS